MFLRQYGALCRRFNPRRVAVLVPMVAFVFQLAFVFGPAVAQESRETGPKVSFEELTSGTGAVLTGHPLKTANLVIVSFTDPLCPYSRHNERFIASLLDRPHDIAVIYRERPLRWREPTVAARARMTLEHFEKSAEARSILQNLPRNLMLSDLKLVAQQADVSFEEFVEVFVALSDAEVEESRHSTTDFSSLSARAFYAIEGTDARLAFRDRLYSWTGPFSRSGLTKLFSEVGLDPNEIWVKMYSFSVEQELDQNANIAHTLDFFATPNYVLIADSGQFVMLGWNPELVGCLLEDGSDCGIYHGRGTLVGE